MEPLLKYNRLGNDLKKVLSADPASCLAVHSKVKFESSFLFYEMNDCFIQQTQLEAVAV